MKTRTRISFLNRPQALYVYIVVHINGRKISKSCRNTDHSTPAILSLLHLILSVSQYEGVCFMLEMIFKGIVIFGLWILVLKFLGKSEIDEN